MKQRQQRCSSTARGTPALISDKKEYLIFLWKKGTMGFCNEAPAFVRALVSGLPTLLRMVLRAHTRRRKHRCDAAIQNDYFPPNAVPRRSVCLCVCSGGVALLELAMSEHNMLFPHVSILLRCATPETENRPSPPTSSSPSSSSLSSSGAACVLGHTFLCCAPASPMMPPPTPPPSRQCFTQHVA